MGKGQNWEAIGWGVGGMLYTLRPEGGVLAAKYSYANGRGDVVAQANQGGTVTWTASYEAFGTRKLETGTNADRQRANTKEEDPTGLLNEGFRYRDLETGTWLSRDPAGFVDGPNLYAYVSCNPWTKFDPLGLYQQMPAALLHANGINTTSHEYQEGFRRGAAQGAAMGLAIGAGVVATVAAAPVIAAGCAAVGLTGSGATAITVLGSGAAGGYAGNATSNVLKGEPMNKNAGTALAAGALLNGAGHVVGKSVTAFKEGFNSVKPIAPKASTPVNAPVAGLETETSVPFVNPITVKPGGSQSIDPGSVRAGGQQSLSEARIAKQAELIASETPRAGGPPQVNTEGTIVDGHHHLRAAADAGKRVNVSVVDYPIESATNKPVTKLPTHE